MKKPYDINWDTNTLTMTKKFAAQANTYGTDAYFLSSRWKPFSLAWTMLMRALNNST